MTKPDDKTETKPDPSKSAAVRAAMAGATAGLPASLVAESTPETPTSQSVAAATTSAPAEAAKPTMAAVAQPVAATGETVRKLADLASPSSPPRPVPRGEVVAGSGGEVLFAGNIKLSTGTVASVRVALQYPDLSITEQREIETTRIVLGALEVVNERRTVTRPAVAPPRPAAPPQRTTQPARPAPVPPPAARHPQPPVAPDTRGAYPGSPFPRPTRT